MTTPPYLATIDAGGTPLDILDYFAEFEILTNAENTCLGRLVFDIPQPLWLQWFTGLKAIELRYVNSPFPPNQLYDNVVFTLSNGGYSVSVRTHPSADGSQTMFAVSCFVLFAGLSISGAND